MYAKSGRLDFARLVFGGMDMKNSMSWNTMIDAYMKNGNVRDAIELFDEMPERDAVSWTALIGGFVKKRQFEQALEWFREMQMSGVEADYVTIIAVIAACADLGTLGLGLWINRFVMKQDFKQNIRIKEALVFFNLMQKEGFKPDGVSFTGALTACSHAGLVDEGLHLFDNPENRALRLHS
ncbi:hypothetical protein M0R45_015862 [Rubus argutus]|uniref:Pentatricopeptide repeat-containing protein n=1 Tax=Rubus argutus TaxID=59490 RepID=A0AAW1XQT1_RUBAR